MRTSAIIWIIIIIVIAAGGWYYYTTQMGTPADTAASADNYGQAPSPSGAAGVNGSPNQGNLGQPDTGAVQQPMADGAEGTVIGGNVSLGIDRSTTLGTYLIGYNSMTVYTFANDKTTSSTCYDQCAQNWPPYLVGAEDNVNNVKMGVNGKVDSTIRTDGGIQVTYNGHPLYFFAGDKASGDTNGQNVGKVWFVVKP